MKKLDWLVVKSFIGPFILTFFIAQFVLVMQFLWKYIDDLVGKGLDTWVLGKLLIYASASLVPLALPLAVLLASIMTFVRHLVCNDQVMRRVDGSLHVITNHAGTSPTRSH